ncbi:MAG: hypothetical protein COA45_00205 [Zetaproteobacteria bacterium]|nr:MAG: hypothetical protein COA45_00205 [Zetaproteobacteria bacterium]
MRAFNAELHDEFLEHAKDIKSSFIMEAPMMCMGQVDLDVLGGDASEEDLQQDVDIYNGTYITPHGGAARVAYHDETNTLCLIASKTAVNLRGERTEDGGVGATEDGLSKSYIISAYRLKDDGSNFDRVKLKLREALQNYDLELGKRAKKHFGQFSASFKQEPSISKDVDEVKFTEVFTNGYAAYLLHRTQTSDGSDFKEECDAEFYASVKRHDGHFVPMNFNGSAFSIDVSKVSKSVVEKKSYIGARDTINSHWGRVSSRLWDQEPLYAGEGVGFLTKIGAAGFLNYINDSKKYVFPTAAVSAAVFAKNPALGVTTAVGLTVGHTFLHKMADGGFHGFLHTYNKVKEARKRVNIEDYSFDEDTSDYFKIHTRNNLSSEKIAPKMDMKRFSAEEFSFLNAQQSGLMHNHTEVEDGLRPEDVRSLLLFGHQRGFTSTVGFLDKSTRIDAFQNGIMRVMHNQPDGKVVVHAQYQPKLCTNEALRLPQVYIDQFEGGILRLEYDPAGDRFKDSVQVDVNVPVGQVIKELCHVQLFRNQSYTDQNVQQRSRDIVSELFAPVIDVNPFEDFDPDEDKKHVYMGGRPFGVPDADAIAEQCPVVVHKELDQ